MRPERFTERRAPTHATPLGDALRALLLRLALNETDPAEREARLQILREDGLL